MSLDLSTKLKSSVPNISNNNGHTHLTQATRRLAWSQLLGQIENICQSPLGTLWGVLVSCRLVDVGAWESEILTQVAILMAYQPISRSGLCADVGEMLARCEPAYWCLTRVDNVSDWDG
jgi:hypothetical protein